MCGALLGFGVLAAPSAQIARAAEPPTGEMEIADAPLVRVHLVGPLGGDPAFRQLLEEWLGNSGLSVVVVRQAHLRLEDVTRPAADGPPVRVWVVAVDEHRARLYIAEPSTARYLVREVPVPSGFDEVGRERIVQIVLVSALAFLEQRASSSFQEVERAMIEDVRPSPPRQPPTPHQASSPVRERDRRSPAHLALGAVYGLALQGAEGVADGPGMVVQVGTGRDRARVAAFLLAQARLPRDVAARHLGLRIGEVAVSGGVAVEVGRAPLVGRSEIGPALAAVWVDPDATTPGVRVVPPQWDVRPFLHLGLGLEWRLRAVWLALLGRCDVQPARTVYQLQGAEGRMAELSAPVVIPGVFAEVGWHQTLSRPIDPDVTGPRRAASRGATSDRPHYPREP